MPSCDMCGAETQLYKTKIEGTILDVCKGCARFGEITITPHQRTEKKLQKEKIHQLPKKEIIEILDPDYANKIRTAREKLGMTQEEFSKRLNEKWSLMQKIETGQIKPSINLARKLEKILRIHLIDQYDESGNVPLKETEKKTDGFTLGDFIKKK